MLDSTMKNSEVTNSILPNAIMKERKQQQGSKRGKFLLKEEKLHLKELN